MLELVRWQLLLVDFPNEIPEFDVFVLQEHDQAGRLRVEGAGDVQDSVVDEIENLLVRDWRGVLELVDGATIEHSIREGG